MIRALVRVLLLLLLITAAAGTWTYKFRPGMEAYAAHRYAAPTASDPAAPALSASWFGTTAVLLGDGQHAVMVDPFFTRPDGLWNLALNREIAPDEKLIADWLRRAGVQKLDAVLVSHSHYDHAMDAGVVARLTGAQLFGSASTGNIGRGVGLPEAQIRLVQSGAPAQIGPFRVAFIDARHAGRTGGRPTGNIASPLTPPARYLDYKQGGTYSILVEHPLGTVLHHGSAGFVPGALQGRKADVVFLGIALVDDLPSYLREVVDAVGARRVIPTHWDDFTRPLSQPLIPFLPVVVRLDRFFADMEVLRPAVQVQTLEPGQRAVLFRQR
jgi:L-ascorbate metabolism protein UlaG (beta-lactamase superfamily)